MKKPKHPVSPKRPFPIAFKLFFVVCAILIGGAAVRFFEEKHLITQLQMLTQQKEEMQEALGWGSELSVEKQSGPAARVRLLLRDKQHNPIQGATVAVTFSRANDDGVILSQNHINLPLTMTEPGVYRANATIPYPGEWSVSVMAQIGHSSYQTSQKITLP